MKLAGGGGSRGLKEALAGQIDRRFRANSSSFMSANGTNKFTVRAQGGAKGKEVRKEGLRARMLDVHMQRERSNHSPHTRKT